MPSLQMFSLAAFGCLVFAGCASDDDDTVNTVSQDVRPVCYSSDDCAEGRYCTTEDGVCNSPCRPNQVCAQVCTGTCRKDKRPPSCGDDPTKTYVSHDPGQCALIRFACAENQTPFSDECGCGCQTTAGEACGAVTCESGQVCCNASCGICTPPDGFCTQQVCE